MPILFFQPIIFLHLLIGFLFCRVRIKVQKKGELLFVYLMVLWRNAGKQLLSKHSLLFEILLLTRFFWLLILCVAGTDITILVFLFFWRPAMMKIQMFVRFVLVTILFCVACEYGFLPKWLPLALQAAVYGVGVCAEFGGSVFKPLVRGSLFICCIFAFLQALVPPYVVILLSSCRGSF